MVVSWGIVSPAQTLISMARSLQWDLVATAIVALWIGRFVPGIEGERPRETAKADEPVYILMVRSGERLSKYSSLRD